MSQTSILMKFNTLILLCMFLFPGSQAQSKDDMIRTIRQRYQQINNDHSLTQVKLENEEIADEIPDGGYELTGYYLLSPL
jgi:hypothetical protein